MLRVAAFTLLTLIVSGQIGQVQAGTLRQIETKGRLVVCAFDNRLPFSTQDRDTPGYQIELARAIADRLDVELEVRWILYRFNARRAKCDLQMETIVTGRSDDDEAEEESASQQPLQSSAAESGQAIFNLKQRKPPRKSIAYVAFRTYLVTRPDLAGMRTYADLAGHKTAVMHQTWAHFLLDRNGVAVITRYDDEYAMLEALAAGEIDAAFASNVYYDWFRRNNPDANLVVAEDFEIDPDLNFDIGLALRGADEELVNRVNGILRTLLDDGTVSRIMASYGITYLPPAATG